MSLFDQLSLSVIHTHKSSRVKCVSFHPDQPLALLGLFSGSACLLNYRTRTVDNINIGRSTTRACCFLTYPQSATVPNGQVGISYVVTGSDDGYIRFIDLQSRTSKCSIHAHNDFIRCICCHPTLPILFSCGDDGLIKAWQYADLKSPTVFWGNLVPLKQLIGHDKYVKSLCCDPSGTRMISSASDGTIKCWDISRSSLIEARSQGSSESNDSSNTKGEGANNEKSALQQQPGDSAKRFMTSFTSKVSGAVGGVADSALNKLLDVIGTDKQSNIEGFGFGIDERYAFKADIGCLSTFAGHTQGVNAACWFNSVSTSGSSNQPNEASPATSLKSRYFYGGSDYILSGGDDTLIKIFDTQNKSCVATLSHCNKAITCALFIPEIASCVTGSEDGSISFINTNTMGLDRVIDLDMERIWCVGATKQFGAVIIAVGTDEGCVLFRVGDPLPPFAVSNTEFWDQGVTESDSESSNDDAQQPQQMIAQNERIRLTIGGEFVQRPPTYGKETANLEESGYILVSPGSFTTGIATNSDLLRAINANAIGKHGANWKGLQAGQVPAPIKIVSYSANNKFIAVVSHTDYAIYSALTLKKKMSNLCSSFAFASGYSPSNFLYEDFMTSSNPDVIDKNLYNETKRSLVMLGGKIVKDSYFAYVPHNKEKTVILSSIQKQGEPIASVEFDFKIKTLIGGPYLTVVSENGFMLLLDWTRSLKLVCQLNMEPTKLFWSPAGDMMAISVLAAEKSVNSSDDASNESATGSTNGSGNAVASENNNKNGNISSANAKAFNNVGKTYVVLVDNILVNAYIDAGEGYYDEEEGIPQAVSLVGKIDTAIDSAAFSKNGSMLVFGIDYSSSPNSMKAMLAQAHSDGAISATSSTNATVAVAKTEILTNAVFSVIFLKNSSTQKMTLSTPVAHIISNVHSVLAVLRSAEPLAKSVSSTSISSTGSAGPIENDIESILLLAESGTYHNSSNIYETGALSVVKSKIDLTMMRFHKLIEACDFNGAVDYIIKRSDRRFNNQEIMHIVDTLKISASTGLIDIQTRDKLCFKLIDSQKHLDEEATISLKFTIAEKIANIQAMVDIIDAILVGQSADEKKLIGILGINRIKSAANLIFKAGLVNKAYDLYSLESANDFGMRLLCAYVMLDIEKVTEVAIKALKNKNFAVSYKASVLMSNISGNSAITRKNANKISLLSLIGVGGENAMNLSTQEIAYALEYACDNDTIISPKINQDCFNGADALLFIRNHPELDDTKDNALTKQLLRRWDILSRK